MNFTAKRHNSLKSFLVSVLLVAAQFCWLVVVFAFILRMVSLASVFKRLDAHESIPLVDCCVMAACVSLFLCFRFN